MLDLIIKNGKVVSAEITVEADIAVKDGKVVGLGKAGDMPEAKRAIDANGKYVIPGGIDTHVHFELPFMGQRTKDDFFEGTRAAAIGGTTTCIDFATQPKDGLPMDILKERMDSAEKKVAIDTGFHCILTNGTKEALEQMKEIIDIGVPSFKSYMTYSGQGLMADDATLIEAMKRVKEHNGLFGCHAENDPMSIYNIQKALADGHQEAIWHALTKPPIVEAEAVNRALYLAKEVGIAYYNFHLSCKEGVDMIRRARNEGMPAYAETITHYLIINKEKLEGPDGYNYICSPPLRDRDHTEALWEGIRDGTVQTIGSDEAAYDTKQKRCFGESFEKVPNGLPGLEFRMIGVFSEGVSKGRIDINKYVAVTSTNAAKIFGMYPRKGTIAVGSDADIVIIDPDKEKTITKNDVQIDVDWCPYEGITAKGWPIMTISNGRIIVEDGRYIGSAGDGEILKLSLSKDINNKILV